MRFILVIFSLVISVFAADIYLMPRDSNNGKNALIKEINNAQSLINVAIYSFTHKQIAKALKNAAKKGVVVNIITNYEDRNKGQIGYLSKYKNINVFTLKGLLARSGKYYGKMHLKLAIIDNKTSIYGSANWSNSAFGLNHETLIIDKDYQNTKKFSTYYQEILKDAKKF